jgi:hypothetical protein
MFFKDAYGKRWFFIGNGKAYSKKQFAIVGSPKILSNDQKQGLL